MVLSELLGDIHDYNFGWGIKCSVSGVYLQLDMQGYERL